MLPVTNTLQSRTSPSISTTTPNLPATPNSASTFPALITTTSTSASKSARSPPPARPSSNSTTPYPFPQAKSPTSTRRRLSGRRAFYELLTLIPSLLHRSRMPIRMIFTISMIVGDSSSRGQLLRWRSRFGRLGWFLRRGRVLCSGSVVMI